MHTQPGGSCCCRPSKVGFKIWLSFSLIQLAVCIINSVNFPPTHSPCATVVLNFAASLLRQQVSKCVEILQIKLTHLHMPNKIFIPPRGECIAIHIAHWARNRSPHPCPHFGTFHLHQLTGFCGPLFTFRACQFDSHIKMNL